MFDDLNSRYPHAVRRLLAGFLASTCLVAAPPAAAATLADSPLGTRLAKALRVPHISPARSAALAVDLATGQPLYAQNDALPLAPASNEKLAVTYAALTALGPAFRLETRADESGERDGKTLHGDLYLVGGGDPTLSRADLASLARAVRAAGIAVVDGRVVGDESLFDARRVVAGWKPSFYIDESPPLSALVVDRAFYAGHITQDPALAAALLFRDALRKAGVRVLGEVAVDKSPSAALSVASVHSATLAQIVENMDLESDNFVAELLLKQLGLLQSAQGTSAAGAQTVMRLLGADGIPLAGVRIVDGSGLSQLDRLTADALVTIVVTMWNDPQLRPVLLKALPVAGVSGTLHSRMRAPPLRGNVRAKTGTTNEASALTGFVKDQYAFSIVQNGYPLPYWWARVAQDRFARVLAAQ
jgi:D-alanyl-D-alanine carboxypeptidase/D-alanyl-D-alanine-endopeptidase (penicillin-binding protein 4)